MSFMRTFTEQGRQEIVRSNVNNSTAKSLWTFSKDKRFPENKSICPYVAYEKDVTTFANKKVPFGTSRRKVFTEVNDGPSSWNYNPSHIRRKTSTSFGQSRQKCIANSYISLGLHNIPGPGRYVQTSSSKNKGYSMRPKTANHRNYFIDDHEKQSVPSPFQYEVYTNKQGKTMNSKFKTAALGGAGLMTKESRFKQSLQKTPSVWAYKPKKYGINKKTKGGQIGTKARTSFIDDVSYTAFTPGPGNYKLPTDFGHYKKMSLSVLH